MALRSFTAYLDDLATIRLEMEARFVSDNMQFSLEAGSSTHELFIHRQVIKGEITTFLLTCLHPLNLETSYMVYDQDRNRTELAYGEIVRSAIFDQLYTYDGDDLGASYSAERTCFKFWAPISKEAFLVLEDKPYPMERGKYGVWQAEIDGDWDGARYHYLHRVNGQWLEVHDPYALSSTANSGDSFVINLAKLHQPKRASKQVPISQAIIYEMSVRDFSSQRSAGFDHKSEFQGLTESPQLDGMAIGMDYIKNLGVTHIQLMPLYDFGSVDESYPQVVYNWGYDPVQYNVPEGSFSSNPNDPYARILELQTAIQAYHDADISVIMDVVYNHVYNADTYAFEKIVPGYFYRFDIDGNRTTGTFCGNDVASERNMVSRYIQQSVRQWISLYGFDGFRFDLMGILDINTLNAIADQVKSLYDNVYLYGEGWKMATGLPFEELAHQYNAEQLPAIGFFNDDYRDTLKEILLDPQKLVEKQAHEKIQQLLAGSQGMHFLSPEQSVNYIECHDNATAFDYFHIENPGLTVHDQKRAASFGLQLVLISQGLAFIHSGQEFFRTKNEIDNTYNLPDKINQMDWHRALEFKEHIEFIQELIDFRKAHPALSKADYEAIEQDCSFYWLTEYVLRYTVTGADETIDFIINFAATDVDYQKDADADVIFTYPPLVDKSATNLTIAGQSMAILVRK